MRFAISSVAVALLLAICVPAVGQGLHKGHVVLPDSSIEKLADIGKRAHTNLRMFVPEGGFQSPQPMVVGPPFSGYFFETPASIACVYHLVSAVSGCNPNTATKNPTGGSKAIAVVDAFDDPNAASDLAFFSTQFGLPAPTFSVVYAGGVKPLRDPGWELEESLDIEWAHAMAPSATIYLVEGASNSFTDLMSAVNKANTLVSAAGGGEVTMSWGGTEFSTETTSDSHFTTSGIVYFASTGDAPGLQWPSTSPNVVAVGGTTLRRNPSTGAFKAESAWTEGGGGISQYEPIPAYQSTISTIVGTKRGVPDIAADADPDTGVWVYDSGNGGWYIVGGTSVSSPVLAGIINRAGSFATSSHVELTTIYNNMALTTDFKNTTTGFCGPYAGYSASAGWDFCTGVGSAKSYLGK
jgi:subtilase family serine protease